MSSATSNLEDISSWVLSNVHSKCSTPLCCSSFSGHAYLWVSSIFPLTLPHGLTHCKYSPMKVLSTRFVRTDLWALISHKGRITWACQTVLVPCARQEKKIREVCRIYNAAIHDLADTVNEMPSLWTGLFILTLVGSCISTPSLQSRQVVHEKRDFVPEGWTRTRKVDSHVVLPMRFGFVVCCNLKSINYDDL